LYRHVHEQPRPLSEAAAHVPPPLTEVVSRALVADPAQRFADAEAFAVALGGAAAEAWGPGWLGESGITVVATGPVLSAAVASGRARETLISAPPPAQVAPAPGAPAPAPAEPSVEHPTPADLVPVNRL